MDSTNDELALIDASERILLLPHCLRRSASCQAKYDQEGLQCVRCNPECPINILSQAAIAYGYKGICVAPGGRLAVNYVKKARPKAVVAVACDKELEEGVEGVRELDGIDASKITIAIIPLTKDGCVDTEVDEKQALEIIATGCAGEYAGKGV